MGERGVDREPATERDIAAMAALAKEAMQAGAIGFGTSRTLNHRSSDGSPIATLTAGEDELTGIALGMAAAGKGVLQLVSDFVDEDAEFGMLRRVVERSGRPMSFSLVQSPARPFNYQSLLAHVEDANRRRLRHPRPGAGARQWACCLGLELTVNPFTHYGAYKEIAALSLAERVKRAKRSRLPRPAVRQPPGDRSARRRRSVRAHVPDERDARLRAQRDRPRSRRLRRPRAPSLKRWRSTTCSPTAGAA